MTTEKLYEFYVLSQALSFSLAAKNLFISQGTLSRHMKEIEAELGTVLFQRTTHQITLTDSGKYLSQTIQPLIKKCSHTESMLQIHGLSTVGTIRIGCALEISYASHIHVFISRFMERYPEINIQFEVLASGIPPELLPEFDLIFSPCEYPALPDTICKTFLFEHKVYLAVPPGHRFMFASSIHLNELNGETLIVPFFEEAFGPYAKNHNLAEKNCMGKLHSLPAPNVHTALFWVSMGKGVCIIPKYAKNLTSNEIFLVEVNHEKCCFNEYIYHNKENMNSSAELFFTELCSTFPNQYP